MPASASALSAVIVSGGKQYRVSPGDRILVDRMAGEPGSEVTLDRVLLVADGDDVKVGVPGVEGATVTARVVGPARGPKIDVLRYKSKKRVRVHRGARADLTALEILTVAGKGQEKSEKANKAEKAKKAERAPKAETAEMQASAEKKTARTTRSQTAAATAEAPAPAAKPAPRRARKAAEPEAEKEASDGA